MSFAFPLIVGSISQHHYAHLQDMERQALNVFRMRLLGAEVRGVHEGTKTLKDATSEAIRHWVTNVETTHYILGSAAGPHPFPGMVRLLLPSHAPLCCPLWPPFASLTAASPS